MHVATVLLGVVEEAGATSATSSPTLNTCSTSSAETLQKLEAHWSNVLRHALKS
ncbi:hypothetical protein SAMN05421862_1541 [Pseudomonas extremaustralis]|nr:hypothetical protein SAMN05421862_1541 [Pseudomonas extremaustralis]